jgi:hypothetical protein
MAQQRNKKRRTTLMMNEPKAEYRRRISLRQSPIAKEKHQHTSPPPGGPCTAAQLPACIYVHILKRRVENGKKEKSMVYTTSCLMKRKDSCRRERDENG